MPTPVTRAHRPVEKRRLSAISSATYIGATVTATTRAVSSATIAVNSTAATTRSTMRAAYDRRRRRSCTRQRRWAPELPRTLSLPTPAGRPWPFACFGLAAWVLTGLGAWLGFAAWPGLGQEWAAADFAAPRLMPAVAVA